MKPIKKRIRTTGDNYIFHGTRGDILTLMEYCNMLADKFNELNSELQGVKQELIETKMQKGE